MIVQEIGLTKSPPSLNWKITWWTALSFIMILLAIYLIVMATTLDKPCGLFGQYYNNNPVGEMPALYKYVVPFPTQLASKDAAIWSGWIFIDTEGLYQFFLAEQDGYSIAINREVVSNIPRLTGSENELPGKTNKLLQSTHPTAVGKERKISSIQLTTGFHFISITKSMPNGPETETIKLTWLTPKARTLQEVPSDQLRHEKISMDLAAIKTKIRNYYVAGAALAGISLLIFLFRFIRVPHDRQFIMFLLALSCMLWYGYHLLSAANQFVPIDDSFISLRYAQNLIRGEGFVFNQGERVEGYTNFLWTMFLALLLLLPLDAVFWMQASGLLFTVLSFYLIFRISHDYLSPCSNCWPLKFIALFALAFNDKFMNWSINGLENSLVVTLICAAVYLYLRHGLIFRVVVLFVLACMTRPDCILFFGMTFLHDMIRRRKVDFSPLLIFGGLYLPYFLWKFLYYGYPFPNTFYAKSGSGSFIMERGLGYAQRFFNEFDGYFLIIGLIALFSRRIFSTACLFLSLIIIMTAGIIKVGGDFMYGFRFFIPLVPFIFLLIQEGLIVLFHEVHSRVAARSPWFSRGIIAVMAGVVVLLSVSHLELYPFEGRNKHWWIDTYRETAIILKNRSQPHDSMATSMLGSLGFYYEYTTYDILGLTDQYLAHLPPEGQPNLTLLSGGGKTDPEYILKKEPRYIIFGGPVAQWDAYVYYNPLFQRNYCQMKIPLTNLDYYGIFERCSKEKPSLMSGDTSGSSLQ